MDTPLRSIALWPACVPFLACIVGLIAGLSHRYGNTATMELALLCLPLLWVLAIPTSSWCDAWVQRFVAAAIALLAWMVAEESLNPLAEPIGWWHVWDRSAAVATAMFMLAAGANARSLLRTLGAACACGALVIGILNWHFNLMHEMVVTTFAFGYINNVTTTFGPPLLAWAAFAIVSWRRGERVTVVDRLLLIGGIGSIAAIAVATQRRGAPVAAGAVCGWFAVQWLWPRSRSAAVAVVSVAVAALLWRYLPQVLAPVPELRSERIWLYRAACEGVLHGLPFGYGHNGMLHVQWLNSEAARHFTAAGNGGLHAHNEFLDVALDGGLVALALFLCVVAIPCWRARHIVDPALRAGCQAALVAMGVHLMTDNFYGAQAGQACMWIILALVMLAPSSAPAPRLWRWFMAPRQLAWPLVLLATWGVLHGIRSAFIHEEATPEIKLRALTGIRPPAAVDSFSTANRLLQSWLLRDACEPKMVIMLASDLATETIKVSENDAGSSGRVIAHLVLDDGLRKLGPTLILPRLRARLAIIEHDDENARQWLVAALGNIAFDPRVYQQLDALLRRRPELLKDLPADVARRVQLMHGNALVEPPDLTITPARFDDLVDLYAATRWAMVRGWPWSQLSRPLETLARRGGDIGGIEQLVVQAAIEAPPATFPWLADCAETLEIGTRMDGDQLQHWQSVTSPTQADAIMPLLVRWYPKLFADCDRNHRNFEICRDETHELENNLVRIWGLYRRYQAGQR